MIEKLLCFHHLFVMFSLEVFFCCPIHVLDQIYTELISYFIPILLSILLLLPVLPIWVWVFFLRFYSSSIYDYFSSCFLHTPIDFQYNEINFYEHFYNIHDGFYSFSCFSYAAAATFLTLYFFALNCCNPWYFVEHQKEYCKPWNNIIVGDQIASTRQQHQYAFLYMQILTSIWHNS